MSVSNPNFQISRWSVVGMEGMYAKMFDPPTASPVTPDALAPTNPVPEVMAAKGYLTDALNLPMQPSTPHTVQRALMSDLPVTTWDGQKVLNFFTLSDPDINSTTLFGTYPGPTTRVPRGVVFHGETRGKGPPPHTIHWHGIEPTPMNDGVGHCSMEVGGYTYQWQPNFIGTYFYHCHRNTMMHFEYGLFGLLLIEPPDAFFASIASTNPDGSVVLNNQIPVGYCRDGKRRTAANLTNFPQFPGFNGNLLTAPDPWTGDARLKFATDPHAMTVPYDVEALWVLDDRDSVWSDLAPNARTTYPAHGDRPGINDRYDLTPGVDDFFAFNDFNADYWFVTGVPVPAAKGGRAAIPEGIVIPPELNSGVVGSQVSVRAKVGQTILIRTLDAAYNSLTYRFPMDIVIIAWDGRALGQPPYGHNEAYLVPAGTPIEVSTARRFDALIRTTPAMAGTNFAEVDFINTRGQLPGEAEEVLCTVQIPIVIDQVTNAVPAGTIVINGGATVTKSSRVTLTLSATSDNGNVTHMQFSKDGGVTFFPFELFASTRVVTLTAGDGLKTMTVRYRDELGNVSLPITASITLDATAPAAGTVTINGGAPFTNKRVVTLALSAAADVVQMQFSKDGVNYFRWEPFAASRGATLTVGDGVKSIFVRFRDAAGNISAPASDSITLDTVAPTGTIAFSTADPTSSAVGTMVLSASDAGSGVTEMQFAKNGSGFFAWEPFATSRTARLSPGLNTLTVRFRDAAGNVSAPFSDSITRI